MGGSPGYIRFGFFVHFFDGVFEVLLGVIDDGDFEAGVLAAGVAAGEAGAVVAVAGAFEVTVGVVLPVPAEAQTVFTDGLPPSFHAEIDCAVAPAFHVQHGSPSASPLVIVDDRELSLQSRSFHSNVDEKSLPNVV